MQNNSKISVCIAYHNMGDLISDLIDSIVAQTYKNWEIIICDNNSTKEEQKKLDEIIKKYKCDIKLIRTGNIGTYSARWQCYKKITGDIIVTPDSDDYYVDSEFFTFLAKTFENPEIDIIRYNYTRNPDANTPFIVTPDEFINASPKEGIDLLKKIIFEEHVFNSLTIHSFRKSLLDKIDVDPDMYMRYFEDDYMFLDLLDAASGIKFSNNVYYNYRINSDSISSTMHQDDRFKEDFERHEKQHSKYAKKWGFDSYDEEANYNFIYKVILLPVVLLTNTNKSFKELKESLKEYYEKYELEINNHSLDDKFFKPYERFLAKLFFKKRFTAIALYIKGFIFVDKVKCRIESILKR
ncbi:MAG: glycosyltransferase [Coriobacteriia bacterium]|nr:glycosyltransferase [Coriobacteriia bacterium]